MCLPVCGCYVMFACLCVYVMFCQRLLSLVFGIRKCCGSICVCLKKENWVEGNQSMASILRCEAERHREKEAERDKDRRKESRLHISYTLLCSFYLWNY